MEFASRRSPFGSLNQNSGGKPFDQSGLLDLVQEVARGWKLDASGNLYEAGRQYATLNGATVTTVGLVLKGTDVDFMVRNLRFIMYHIIFCSGEQMKLMRDFCPAFADSWRSGIQ